jgi:hypothetical protein
MPVLCSADKTSYMTNRTATFEEVSYFETSYFAYTPFVLVDDLARAVARPIMGGDVYSYIRVLIDEFLLKAIVFTVCKHEYMNIPPPPPPPPIMMSSYVPGLVGLVVWRARQKTSW